MKWSRYMHDLPHLEAHGRSNCQPGADASSVGGTAGAELGPASPEEAQCLWPRPDTLYVTDQISPAVSSVPNLHSSEVSASRINLENLMAEVFGDLSSVQEPLGAEFEAVWAKYADELYA